VSGGGRWTAPRLAAAGLGLIAVLVAVLLVTLNATGDGSSPSESAGGAEPLPRVETPVGAGRGSDQAGGELANRGVDPPRKAIWGPVRMPAGGSAFPIYERLGVDVFQIQLPWADVAASRPANPSDPADPAYGWPPELEAAIREGRRAGIDVAVMVTTTPGWANGGRARIRAPSDPSDLADFLTAAARHYPAVHHWMVWGEPNRSDRFLPNAPDSPVGPRAYAVLLDHAYRALKDASEKNVVISGPIFTGGDVKPPDFLRWLRLPDGHVPRLDWFGLNPYPFRLPDLSRDPEPGGYRDLSDLDTVRRELAEAFANAPEDPPLWLSEFTVQSGRDSRYFEFHVSESEQAEWLRAGFEAAGRAGGVAGLGWFTLLDQSPAAGSADWGLMTASAEPKPAFEAYEMIGR